MKFVVFNAAGDPIRAGSCPDEAVEQQAQDGETAVPWPAKNGSPLDWRLVAGEPVQL